MSDEQLETIYNEMKEMFPNLPNFIYYPIGFAHYVKLFHYMKRESVDIK